MKYIVILNLFLATLSINLHAQTQVSLPDPETWMRAHSVEAFSPTKVIGSRVRGIAYCFGSDQVTFDTKTGQIYYPTEDKPVINMFIMVGNEYKIVPVTIVSKPHNLSGWRRLFMNPLKSIPVDDGNGMIFYYQKDPIPVTCFQFTYVDRAGTPSHHYEGFLPGGGY